MTTGNPARRERGFSLIELMIAMVATLVISGAVMQLVSAGQGAFRREPELSDRQQNIRMAMSMIQQDVQGAGLGLPPFSQAFTNSLNALGPTAPSGSKTDELEILTMTACPILTVCKATGTNVDTWEALPACYGFPTMIALWNSTETGIFWGDAPGNGGGTQSCNASGGNTGTGSTGGNSGGSGGQGGGNNGNGNGGNNSGGSSSGGSGNTGDKNGHVVMPHGQDRFSNPPGGPGFVPTYMGIISVMRYRVVVDANGVPNLWRSAYGGSNRNGQSSWQMVARGIEDLQVTYRNAGGWADTPGNVSCLANCTTPGTTEYNRIIRQVRVVLSGRAVANNLQGATTSTAGPTAVRGQLRQEMAPRAALIALSSATGTNKWY